MVSIGKKILSAFVEVTDAQAPLARQEDVSQASRPPVTKPSAKEDNDRFRQYFNKLFEEANLPGPDYHEFSKMIDAMSALPDEKARYLAAFAGLQAQGLSRQQLIDTASGYLQVLDKDAVNFLSTVDATLEHKVHAKQKEIATKTARISELQSTIGELEAQIAVLHTEVKENEEKIEQSTGGYKTALGSAKSRIVDDIEKIKKFI